MPMIFIYFYKVDIWSEILERKETSLFIVIAFVF
jgi:hypothetical protein